jgi:hypothetical protein
MGKDLAYMWFWQEVVAVERRLDSQVKKARQLRPGIGRGRLNTDPGWGAPGS